MSHAFGGSVLLENGSNRLVSLQTIIISIRHVQDMYIQDDFNIDIAQSTGD